jgi:DNA gyrase/topoisomerase IV subunit A
MATNIPPHNLREVLVVTELPYQVNPDNLVESIAELVKDGRVAGIADINDESSDRIGMRIVITLKRDAVAKVVLNNLYKHTQLQTTFGANMLAIVDGVPRTLRLDQMIATTSRTRSRSSSGAPSTGCARSESGRTSCAACSRRSTSSTRSSR